MKRTKTTLWISLLFFGLFFVSSGKVNAEVIRNFDSQIKINSDSSVLVTEKIEYDFGVTERHGIYRNIPIDYAISAGNKSISIGVESVTIDGLNTNYEVSKSGSDEVIKIGKSDSLIMGVHVYTIVYKVKGAINYFKDFDELYFNVTGNGWSALIENSSVSLLIPSVSKEGSSISCYQGTVGSNEKCQAEIKDNQITAKATRALGGGEGLTIALDFSKGIVYKPTKIEEIIGFAKDNPIVLLPILVAIVMFFIWRKYGKDPKGYSTIIAQYEPPKDMKPTLVGSLVDEKPDFRDITAGLIYLAEQGYVKIKRLEKEGIFGSIDYEIELTKNDVSSLENTEQNILKLFFENDLKIGLNKKLSSFERNTTFSIGAKNMIKDLYQEMTDKNFFVKNPSKVKRIYAIIAILIIFLSVKLFGSILGFTTIISIIASAVIIAIFGSQMSKKTKLGAETKDYILGFKEFLSVTEKDRLDFHNAPEKSPEQFMEFLPYAIALGVENKWAKQFENVYINQPTWYQGNFTNAFVATSFVSHLSDFSKSVNTGLALASKGAAGGRFGGGGGGFSGGGFGGGGGGSW